MALLDSIARGAHSHRPNRSLHPSARFMKVRYPAQSVSFSHKYAMCKLRVSPIFRDGSLGNVLLWFCFLTLQEIPVSHLNKTSWRQEGEVGSERDYIT